MKNYMANKSFSRGVETLGAEASMVFVGNISHTVPYMLKNSDLFEELPEQYHDPAFLDRIHCYVPGWEFEQIRGEMFSSGYGFVVDYLAEVLRSLRDIDYSHHYERYFALSDDLSTRDRDGIHKTFSGLMKLIHPSGQASPDEIGTQLRIALEGRKRVKDQLIRIDDTMTAVNFEYTHAGQPHKVTTLEEDEYPELYHPGTEASAARSESAGKTTPTSGANSTVDMAPKKQDSRPELKEQRLELAEGRRGFTFDRYIGPYMRGATRIDIVDPYIRQPYQARNLMELIETIAKYTDTTKEITVHLTTKCDKDPDYATKQQEKLETIRTNSAVAGIKFEYSFNDTIHDRSITTDTDWIIMLGRGLDVFQPFDTDWLDLRLRQQYFRQIKEFTIAYMRKQ